jgi:pimeloyl-ACP methyl ester carboxylesterase
MSFALLEHMVRFASSLALIGAVIASCEGKRSWNARLDDAPSTHARINRHAHHRITDNKIHPFEIHATDAEIVDLIRRLDQTRWPDRETVNDGSQGVPLAILQELVFYWRTDYNWRAVEARLNALPQFVTNIDGVDIHFIHVRSRYPNAMPIIITHGWPGSIIELLKVIGPLTDPPAYGGRADDAFHVILPSIPGFGFSGKPTSTGWTTGRIATVWSELMTRLGYGRYVAHGNDFGASITRAMARQHAPGLAAIHLTAISPEEPPYATLMSARPQAVGVAISDSPAGLAAWMLQHPGYTHWTGDFKRSPTRDDVLDNFTLYWLTKSATSSARLYWEDHQHPVRSTAEITVPVTIAKDADLSAWEQPLLFAEQLRTAFRSLR